MKGFLVLLASHSPALLGLIGIGLALGGKAVGSGFAAAMIGAGLVSSLIAYRERLSSRRLREELEARRSDQKLQGSDRERLIEVRMAQAASIARLGIWEWDAVSDKTIWNDEMFKIYGVRAEDFTGKGSDYVGFTRADYREAQMRNIQKSISEGLTEAEFAAGKMHPSDPKELCIVRPNGSECYTLGEAVCIVDDSKKIVRMIGVTIDITETKRAEEILAAEKERLAITLRSIGDGVITTDIHGNVELVNQAAEQLTGWSQEEARGKPLSAVYNILTDRSRKPSEYPNGTIQTADALLAMPNYSFLRHRDGSERIIAESGAPIRNKQRENIGVVIVFRDITERIRLVETVQRADKLESLGILAGGIAHDFNNLLSGIFGYMELAKTSASGDSLAYLEKAMGVFNRAKDLTRQLLTFSKGDMPVRKTGSLEPVLRRSAKFALSGSTVSCVFTFAEDLWACDFDENQIAQVIDNLVINAQQAMPRGGQISVVAENRTFAKQEHKVLPEGRYVCVSVQDEGVGIPHDIQSRIFDPFFTTKAKGNGLGLATSYSILHKHDGHIEVDSETGRGSIFRVYLPESKLPSQPVEMPAVAEHVGHGHVLVMDDEEFNRELARSNLESMGYAVIPAADGEDAIQKCSEAKMAGTPIRLALLDLTVPGGMGGLQTAENLKRLGPDMILIATSGYADDPVMANPGAFGFTHCLRKPFLKPQLSEVLNSLVVPRFER